MDKWEKIAAVIAAGIDAEDKESIFAGFMKMIVEFGRTFELLGEDLDRLATAAEKANEPFENVTISGDDALKIQGVE